MEARSKAATSTPTRQARTRLRSLHSPTKATGWLSNEDEARGLEVVVESRKLGVKGQNGVSEQKNDPSERTERVIFSFAAVFLRSARGFVKRLEQFRETPDDNCVPDRIRTCDLWYRKPML